MGSDVGDLTDECGAKTWPAQSLTKVAISNAFDSHLTGAFDNSRRFLVTATSRIQCRLRGAKRRQKRRAHGRPPGNPATRPKYPCAKKGAVAFRVPRLASGRAIVEARQGARARSRSIVPWRTWIARPMSWVNDTCCPRAHSMPDIAARRAERRASAAWGSAPSTISSMGVGSPRVQPPMRPFPSFPGQKSPRVNRVASLDSLLPFYFQMDEPDKTAPRPEHASPTGTRDSDYVDGGPRWLFPFMLNSAVQARVECDRHLVHRTVCPPARRPRPSVRLYWPILVCVLLFGGVGLSVQTPGGRRGVWRPIALRAAFAGDLDRPVGCAVHRGPCSFRSA